MKPTVTIGIPAYNESKNIKQLIYSILRQQSAEYRLQSIIVSSDGSTDGTAEIAQSVRSSKVKVYANRTRQGIARGLNQILSHNESDILVTLDADIVINSNDFIAELIRPILRGKADLTSSAIQPIIGSTTVARTLYFAAKIKATLYDQLPKNNIYHCYGLARAYSSRLSAKLRFPVSIGNDMYVYLYCEAHLFRFHYVNKAIAWYKLPTNYRDHISQSRRFTVSGPAMELEFGTEMVKRSLQIPFVVLLKTAIIMLPTLAAHPLMVAHYIMIYLIVRFTNNNDVSPKWVIAESSK